MDFFATKMRQKLGVKTCWLCRKRFYAVGREKKKNNDGLKKLSQNTHGNKYVLLKKKERFQETVMFAFSLIFHKHFYLMCIIRSCLNTSTKSVEIYLHCVEAVCWLTNQHTLNSSSPCRTPAIVPANVHVLPGGIVRTPWGSWENHRLKSTFQQEMFVSFAGGV